MTEPLMTTDQPDSTNLPERHTPPQSTRHLGKTLLTILVTAAVTFALTVGGGAYILTQAGVSLLPDGNYQTLGIAFDQDAETQSALEKLRSVYSILDQNYYKDLSDADMLAAMTRGLVNEMDSPYTMYLDADQTKQIADSLSGNYVGIGAIVSFNSSQQVEITEVLDGSPAQAAGVQVGDLFIAVDGQNVESVQDVTEVAVLVRGEEGTYVEIEMYRPVTHSTYTKKVERKPITSASVTYHMLTDQIGYVRISEFSTGVADHFIIAIEDLKSQGARNIVFDLRNDSGGLANEVIQMLDYLLPKATIAKIEGRQDGKAFSQEWQSDASQGVPSEMRYAILINEFTASASELFTGCLRDYDLAKVIGNQSFGKGSGTLTFNLSDGSSANVTNFLYYLPGGTSIEGIGIEPDEVIDLPQDALGKSIPQLTATEDTQLAAAIEYLQTLAGN